MGTLITKPVIINGSSITVNAAVVGAMRVRLLDKNGEPIKDFDWVNISGDAVDHPVEWNQDLKTLNQKPVQMEFQLQDALLYSFDLKN